MRDASTVVSDLPLCVDLDGTLVETDTLVELCISSARRNPGLVLCWPFWLLRGKANFKHEIVRRTAFDPTRLPYNLEFLSYLRQEKRRGRHLVLATASHRVIADAVAAHLGLFDAALASDQEQNLRGRGKARILISRFGFRGFSYAGNDRSDLAVWQAAASAVLVGVPRRVARRIPASVVIERCFDAGCGRWRSLLRSLRRGGR